MIRDFNMASVWAGLTAFVWYAFGALPLHLEVAGQLGLSTSESSSWIFVIWFAGAITSIALSLFYRLPIPITWTIPGLIYLGTLSGQFSFAEIVGANLIAGVAILLLGAFGIGERIMAWLPLPIVMGMFGGSILVYVTRMVAASVADVLVAGITLLVVSIWLQKRGKPIVYTLVPMILVGAATVWAMSGNVIGYFLHFDEQWLLAISGTIILALDVWVMLEGMRMLFAGANAPPALAASES